MEKLTRRRYTLEYKQEAIRLVSPGQKVAAAAKALRIVDQSGRGHSASQLRRTTTRPALEAGSAAEPQRSFPPLPLPPDSQASACT
jgi:transposase